MTKPMKRGDWYREFAELYNAHTMKPLSDPQGMSHAIAARAMFKQGWCPQSAVEQYIEQTTGDRVWFD